MIRARSRVSALALVVVLCLGGCSSADSSGTAKRSSTSPAGASSGRPPTTRARAAVASAGCRAGATTAMKDKRIDMKSGAQARWYLLTTPRLPDGRKPVPLIVDFHGLLEGAQVHVQMSQFGRLAQRKGFIVATPNGTGNPVGWNISEQSSANLDLAFVTKLLDSIESAHCVDTSRVYSTGLSDGALFSSLLACTMADRFTAIAPVAGLAMPKNCHPSRRIPVLTFHGTADPILLFNGGIGDTLSKVLGGKSAANTTTTTAPADLDGKGFPAAVAAWAASDGCDPKPVDRRVKPDLIRRTYRCPSGVGVEFIIVVGGGHTWPGSQFSKAIASIVGPTTFSVDATAEIYRWLVQYHL